MSNDFEHESCSSTPKLPNKTIYMSDAVFWLFTSWRICHDVLYAYTYDVESISLHFPLWGKYEEKLKNTKEIIRSRKSKKERQNNDQQKRDERTNKYLQNTTKNTNDWETRTSLNAWGKIMCSWNIYIFFYMTWAT